MIVRIAEPLFPSRHRVRSPGDQILDFMMVEDMRRSTQNLSNAVELTSRRQDAARSTASAGERRLEKIAADGHHVVDGENEQVNELIFDVDELMGMDDHDHTHCDHD